MSTSTRLVSVDLLRGGIMVLMAIDHASFLVAGVHATEFWGYPLPAYDDAGWFLTRFVTHFCAPGFFLLMGIGMAHSERPARWFALRGGLLVLLQLLVEDPAWLIGSLGSGADAGVGAVTDGRVAGGGSEIRVHLGVLYALGMSMLMWGVLRRLPSLAIAALSVAAIVVSALYVPGNLDPDTLYGPLARLLLVPGHSNWLQVYYPLLPWVGVTGLGLILGRELRRRPARTMALLPWLGLGLLVLFALMRAAGAGDAHAPTEGWIGWLNLTKYPPGPAFLSLTVGGVLLGLALAARVPASALGAGNPLLVFGGSALFFYLLHLYVYAAMGLVLPRGGLAMVYGSWLAGLAVLYPACRWYGSFKRGKAADSVWRLF
ncbi:MAG: DUF1624 domain-containing protein [Gemmatimonadota bacterium]